MEEYTAPAHSRLITAAGNAAASWVRSTSICLENMAPGRLRQRSFRTSRQLTVGLTLCLHWLLISLPWRLLGTLHLHLSMSTRQRTQSMPHQDLSLWTPLQLSQCLTMVHSAYSRWIGTQAYQTVCKALDSSILASSESVARQRPSVASENVPLAWRNIGLLLKAR